MAASQSTLVVKVTTAVPAERRDAVQAAYDDGRRLALRLLAVPS
jgi:hypothetical protein